MATSYGNHSLFSNSKLNVLLHVLSQADSVFTYIAGISLLPITNYRGKTGYKITVHLLNNYLFIP